MDYPGPEVNIKVPRIVPGIELELFEVLEVNISKDFPEFVQT